LKKKNLTSFNEKMSGMRMPRNITFNYNSIK
jgi:hypothetical protein